MLRDVPYPGKPLRHSGIRCAMLICLSVGLNCALGAKEMRPHLEELIAKADVFISAYPNAGLPNEFGQYDETAHETAHQVDDFMKAGW